MISKIEKLCQKKGVKLTKSRRIIAKIISESQDHLDALEILRRVNKVDENIGIATIYRALKFLEEFEIISRHEFGGTNRSYYEVEEGNHHDHLIDISTGKIHEFFDESLEKLKEKIANDMGYELIGHKLELYCKPKTKKA